MLLALIVPAAFLLAWQGATSAGLAPPQILPTPVAVWSSLVRLLGEARFYDHVIVSVLRLAVGALIAGFAGAVVGIVMSVSDRAQALLGPFLQVLAPVPPVLYTPLFIVFLGLGDAAKIALIAIGGFFIAVLHAETAARRANAQTRDLTMVYRFSTERRLRHVIVPAVLTEIFLAFRLIVGLGWVLLLAAELIASTNGLGWFINDARNFGRTDEMYAAMIVVAALGYFTDVSFVVLKRRLAPWDRS